MEGIIAGLRDIVVHQYFGLDLRLMWDVVKKDILELKPKILKMMDEMER